MIASIFVHPPWASGSDGKSWDFCYGQVLARRLLLLKVIFVFGITMAWIGISLLEQYKR